MENLNTNGWTSEHEAAYHEERKNRCDYCHPEQEETISWLESIAALDMVHAVYRQHGIPPHIIYKEHYEESVKSQVEKLEVFMEELAS